MASTSTKKARFTSELDYSSDKIVSHGSTDDEAFETESANNEEPDFDVSPPVWSIFTNGMRQITFKKEEKLLIPVPGEGKPIDFFKYLLDDVCLENIVKFTNRNALDVFSSSSSVTPKSRITKWKDLTVPELKTFIALLLHTGTIKLLSLIHI